MNQMVEAWKEIPDLTAEISPPPQSLSSSKGTIHHFFIFIGKY